MNGRGGGVRGRGEEEGKQGNQGAAQSNGSFGLRGLGFIGLNRLNLSMLEPGSVQINLTEDIDGHPPATRLLAADAATLETRNQRN